MKPAELEKKLNAVLADGTIEGIFLDTQPHKLEGAGASQSLAPVQFAGMLELNLGLMDYVHLVENRAFSVMFPDCALAIVECLFTNANLVKHRYTYIPCPVETDEILNRLPEIPVADWILEIASGRGLECFRSVGVYRFDFAPLQAAPNHPSSHLSFVSSECRVPVRAPLSIADFLNFIFDNFYPQHTEFWRAHAPFLRCDGIDDNTITPQQLARQHLHWVAS